MMKWIGKTGKLLLLVTLLFALCAGGISAAPTVNAASAVVLDADTGAFYFEKNPDTQRTQASMTKLMTAYMIFEEIGAGRLNYDSVITISGHGQAIANTNGYSNVPLRKGETYTVDTMLKLILLPSACGACASMGDAISGSESAFVANMNRTAAALGLNAHFANTYGAGTGMPQHYISARSMAELGRIFIQKYPDILKYTSLNSFTFKGKTYHNTNHFLNSDYYAGVDGLKTGTSTEAGSCITVSAQKNGRRIIVVVMKSTSRYSDARKLLDYGFSCVTAADTAALKEASVSIGSNRKDIRLGSDFKVYAQWDQLKNATVTSGGWLVNGKVVSEFYGQKITKGDKIATALNLDSYAGKPVTIGFYVLLPDGTKKQVEKVFSFSNEAPMAFRDIEDHWAEAYITNMHDKKILSGYPDGYFLPENAVTRGEFLTGFMRLLTSCQLLTVAENATSPFTDCHGHWAEAYIAAAYNNGIATGRTATQFDPEAPVTREEIATFVARALQLTASHKQTDFKDQGAISQWALTSVLACAEQSIISGYPDGTFLPQNNASRGEIATILSRTYALLEKRKAEAEAPTPPEMKDEKADTSEKTEGTPEEAPTPEESTKGEAPTL